MPVINTSNAGKRIDMSSFFGDGAYIQIKKMSKTIKRKIQLLSFDGAMTKVTKKMIEESEATGKTIEEITSVELGKYFLDLTTEEREKAGEISAMIEELLLIEGVDPLNHNLTNEHGIIITLGVDFWEYFPEPAAFIMNEVKDYNKDSSVFF